MKIDGHCHCGQITFEAEVDPTALTICHCTDCQTLTGSAFSTVTIVFAGYNTPQPSSNLGDYRTIGRFQVWFPVGYVAPPPLHYRD
jgi:hypothetical protein